MGKNQIFVVVLWIQVKFWCMIPMGVFAQAEHKKNCTEFGIAVLKYRQGRSYR